ATDGARSIHLARWPEAKEEWRNAAAEQVGQAILEVVETVRRWKAERQLSVGAPLAAVRITCAPELDAALNGALIDLRSVTRAREVTIEPSGGATLGVTIEAIEESQPAPAKA